MDQISDILRRLQLGQSCRSIAKSGLCARTKAARIRQIALNKGWLDSGVFIPDDGEMMEAFGIPGKLPFEHTSKVERYSEIVEEWFNQGIRTKTIFDALKRQNPPFEGSYSSLYRFILKLRGNSKEAFIPVFFEPGECAQVDFGSGPILLNPATGKLQRTHIFVMTLCFSRHMYVELVWDQKVKTWLRCHSNAFLWFGGVPRKITIDNLKAAVTKACRYDPAVQRSYEDFAGAYGFIISPCVPRMPRHKGRVEAGVKYVKRSFIPLRDFRDSIVEANRQARQWVMEVGSRIHGTTRQMPLRMFAEMDKPALLSIPDTPYEEAVWANVKVHRDCHVTHEKSYYSAPCAYVGETLWLKATDNLVEIFRETGGKLAPVALHPIARTPGQWRTNNAHLPGEKLAYLMETPQFCREKASSVGVSCEEFITLLLGKGPVDYLRAARGVLKLGKKFGNTRLESACRRALIYDNITYKAVKKILQDGRDQEIIEAVSSLNGIFIPGGRFTRNISQLLCPEKYVERSLL